MHFAAKTQQHVNLTAKRTNALAHVKESKGRKIYVETNEGRERVAKARIFNLISMGIYDGWILYYDDNGDIVITRPSLLNTGITI